MNEYAQEIQDSEDEYSMQEAVRYLFDEMGLTVRTFSDVGLMTNNKGVVLTTPSGTEFQVSIVRSR